MTDDEYDAFFRASYPKLVAMGLAMSAPRPVAQDLAQETLLRAYNRRDELATYDAPVAWCRRVMGNLLIDHHRSRNAERGAVSRLQSRSETSASGLAEANDPARLATSDRWAEITASLTPQQRLAATLFYAEDQSVAEVAVVMNVAVGTVKSALSKARAHLRRRLDVSGANEGAWS